ncbi:MAG TPA: hemolysin III family protein [Solirubrobacterales bacterium]|nr:hemolysin III family protein [Solirubrobacterales bacterium]
MTADGAQAGRDPVKAAREAAEAAGERLDQARAEAGERLGQARLGAGERLGAARDAAGRSLSAARDHAQAAAGAAANALNQKPRLRGVFHQWAFFVSLAAGATLVLVANGSTATIAAAIYAFSLSALLGVSALYHRINWQPTARRWMRRLDHTMIFVLIAGTYTPFALLVLHGDLARIVLIAVWVMAGAGTVLNLLWWNAPKSVTAAVYISTGWVAVLAVPQLWNGLGPVGFGLIILGGVLYTAGAVVYARRRPDPRPAVFGYHEIFHLLVIAAAACDFAAIAIYALPTG